MKVKIVGGRLQALRGKEWQSQSCPFNGSDEMDVQCGDWCPFFEVTEAIDELNKSYVNLCCVHTYISHELCGQITYANQSKR